VFGGWRDAGGARVGGAGSSYAPAADTTLYAIWTAIAPTAAPAPYYPYYPPAITRPTPAASTEAAAIPPEAASAEEAAIPPETAPATLAVPRAADLPASPDPAAYAGELYKLGLFAGTGADSNGNPRFELGGGLTRLQALVVVIRLMGLEGEALGHSGPAPFGDVPGWGAPYAGYAFEKGIAAGIGGELFAPDRLSTAQELSAFLLRALQYFEKSGDFSYENSVLKAQEIGVLPQGDLSGKPVARGDAVVAMVRALLSTVNRTGATLLERLANEGVISEADAKSFISFITGGKM
jgi:hypothetical protein